MGLISFPITTPDSNDSDVILLQKIAQAVSNERTVMQATDQSILNSTTLTDATGLQYAILANTKYKFHAFLLLSPAGTTAGVQIATAGPASPTTVALYCFLQNGVSTVSHQPAAALGLISAQALSSTALKYAILEGTIMNGANAGTFKIQFAQNVLDAVNAITLKAGSFLTVTQFN